MRRQHALCFSAFALLWAGAPAAVGCAGALSAIPAVASAVTEVLDWIGVIERGATAASDAGLLPPEVAARVKRARELAEKLEAEAQKGPAAYQAAVDAWERAYAELTAIVAPLGVRAVAPEQRRLGAPAGVRYVPTGGELGARLRESAR